MRQRAARWQICCHGLPRCRRVRVWRQRMCAATSRVSSRRHRLRSYVLNSAVFTETTHRGTEAPRDFLFCMEFSVDIWLRGDNHATTAVIASVPREPRAWTDGDVAAV